MAGGGGWRGAGGGQINIMERDRQREVERREKHRQRHRERGYITDRDR